jgi:diguanylate cyclase (GGDEF)-like protein
MRIRSFRNLPIKYKLILVIMFTSLLGLLSSSAAMVAYDWHEARQTLIKEQQVLAQVIGQRSSAALAFRDKRGAQENLDALSQQKSIALACLYDGKAVLFLASQTQNDCPSAPEANQQQFSGGYLHIYHQIVLNNKFMGALYLRTSLDALNQKLQRFVLVSSGIMGLVVLLVLLITSRVQRVISAPIQLLGDISLKVSEDKDYSHRAEYNSEDELGMLVNSFNHMMQTIEEAQTELKNLAFKDALTGLPNRRLLMVHMQTVLPQVERSGKSLALFLIDLDGFKAVNDTLGHEAGDWVLIQVSQRLQSCLRAGDLAARLGGDEFTVLLTGCESVSDVRTVATKVCQIIDEPIYFQEQLAKVSASIGISMAPGDAVDAQELMKLADGAMYEAKKAGKNGFFFANASLQQHAQEGQAADEQLLQALQQNRVLLYVDPQYRLETKTIVGGEIKYYEQVSTQDAIECDNKVLACEDKAVIAHINRLVIDSLQQAWITAPPQAWDKLDSLTLRVSFKQLNHPQFIDTFAPFTQQLASHHIRLILAVAERDLLSLQNMKNDFNLRLSQHNMLLAVDVIGRGISFIGRWPDFPVAQVRFKSLPREARVADKQLMSQTSEYLNQVLVELCQYLLCDSVVTHLMEPEQVALFTRINCNYAQGLAFSEVMPLLSFLKMMCHEVPIGMASGQ